MTAPPTRANTPKPLTPSRIDDLLSRDPDTTKLLELAADALNLLWPWVGYEWDEIDPEDRTKMRDIGALVAYLDEP